MPPAVIISLLTTFGPPAINLITGLITQWESQTNITAAQWATLVSQINLTAQDHMKSQLTAAGIAFDDPHAVALLALTK